MPARHRRSDVLQVKDLTKVYPTGRVALSDFTLAASTGVLGLLGPNGAGKSTLLAILAAELGFEAGSVSLDGLDLMRNTSAWRGKLGYMPQSFDIAPQLTGKEFLVRTALLSGIRPRTLAPRISELLGRVRLLDAANREAASYSRGMKQRLAVAATFLCDPTLVLLDEPTSGLDPEERIVFRELLAESSHDRVVILSTHVVADVERCCAQIAIINAGKLCFAGSPSRLIASMTTRVWEAHAQMDVIEEWSRSRRLVSLRSRDDKPYARIIASSQPTPDAVPVEATLEDAYLDLLGTAPVASRMTA
jgi:ABC-type multidrug transport system ATPase subunit